MIKVHGGTPTHATAGLCYSCRRAIIVRGRTLGEEIVQCSELSSGYAGADRVRFKVTNCTRYDDKSRPSLSAMQSIAWELRTDTDAKQIGFMSPEAWSTHREQRGARLAPLQIPWGDDE